MMAPSSKFFQLFIFIYCSVLSDIYVHCSKHVHHFDMSERLAGADLEKQLHSRIRRDTETVDSVESVDQKCRQQEDKFLTEIRKPEYHLEEVFRFDNESYFSMSLAWAGDDDGHLMVVTVKEDIFGLLEAGSNVYRSTDYGKNFKLINDEVDGAIIQKHIGLQRNPHDTHKVYLVGVCHKAGCPLFISEDGAMTFSRHDLGFCLDVEITFHPSPSKAGMFLTMATVDYNKLFLSRDNGRNWKSVLDNVESFKWGYIEGEEDTAETIYATVSDQSFMDTFDKANYRLQKTTDGGQTWQTILTDVISFGHQGKFLYASVAQNPNSWSGDRYMKLSVDGGKNWHEALLPTITPDRFFSVLDMTEGLVFMHVDKPGDTGYGTLYVSAAKGIVFTESLPRHLFPNYGDTTDFYRVKSMRSVYIASQMNDDDSIHSMITYNRGATWQPLPRPDGERCKNETMPCNLQIHGPYSLSRGIPAHAPISIESAVGIILVHGHVADALQMTNPDVFVTSDGGYTWRKALEGPHHYQIADSGGLLVAVSSMTDTPNTLKFSTDEGHCWHEYQYTNESVVFTGLLTQPGSRSMVVSIWGYNQKDRKWMVFVINFKKVIKEKCSAECYVPWMAHELHRAKEGIDTRGCLLGKRETFKRLRTDSWCFNDYNYDPNKETTQCTCTREDYECDYGFYRVAGMDDCIKEQSFSGPDVDICLRGHEEKIVTEGYRKIPGDECKDGFQPTGSLIDMDKRCNENDRVELVIEVEEEMEKADNSIHLGAAAITVISLGVALLVVVMSAYFIHKYLVLKRHKVVYRYSLLNQTEELDYDNECENALSEKSTVYHESEDEELNSTSPVKTNKSRKDGQIGKKGYHDDSDDDMLG